jgi:hypothetical protein
VTNSVFTAFFIVIMLLGFSFCVHHLFTQKVVPPPIPFLCHSLTLSFSLLHSGKEKPWSYSRRRRCEPLSSLASVCSHPPPPQVANIVDEIIRSRPRVSPPIAATDNTRGSTVTPRGSEAPPREQSSLTKRDTLYQYFNRSVPLLIASPLTYLSS